MRHAPILAALLVLAPLARAEDVAPIATAVQADIERHVHDLGSKNGWVSLDALDYLPYFGRAAVPALLDALASSNSNTRCLACVALARIPDARSVPKLIALLDDGGGLSLNVLSEDGAEIHPVYAPPEHTVKQQAQIALQAITGRRFAKKAEWEEFWAKEGAAFTPKPLEKPEWPRVPAQARWLKGVKICLDPGHGGDRDKLGYKRGLTYLSEADLNLRVARYLRDLLVAHGAVVVMTREGDQDVDLKERCRIAHRERVDFFLSIHHNWSPRFDTTATTTWYHLTPDEKPASMDLARAVQEEVSKAIDPSEPVRSGGLMSDGLMYKSGFGVLRDLPPDVPGALCETTYYSCFSMERKLRDLEFNRTEAWGFFLGLVRYLAAGIPRAEVVATQGGVVLQVFDGLEERGEWAKPWKIFSEHTLVRLDGKVVSHDYDPATGKIRIAGSLVAKGEHSLEVVLVNLNGNHSWPKKLGFTK